MRPTTLASLPSPDHRARVLAAVRAEPAPPRATLRARIVLTWLLAAVASITLLLAAGGVTIAPRPGPLAWATSFGAFVIALVAARALVARHGMLGPARDALLLRAFAVPASLVTWKLAWTSAHLPYEGAELAAFSTTTALGCLALGSAVAAGPLVAALTQRRGTELAQPRASGLALGLAAGAWAWVGLDLVCPEADAAHLLVGHLGPVALAGALGALVGPRVLTPR